MSDKPGTFDARLEAHRSWPSWLCARGEQKEHVPMCDDRTDMLQRAHDAGLRSRDAEVAGWKQMVKEERECRDWLARQRDEAQQEVARLREALAIIETEELPTVHTVPAATCQHAECIARRALAATTEPASAPGTGKL